jgi:transposase
MVGKCFSCGDLKRILSRRLDMRGTRVVKLPWAEPGSRFAALFERLAIDWLKVASQKAVGEQLHLSWNEIHGIMDRAVERGLKRRKAAIAISRW